MRWHVLVGGRESITTARLVRSSPPAGRDSPDSPARRLPRWSPPSHPSSKKSPAAPLSYPCFHSANHRLRRHLHNLHRPGACRATDRLIDRAYGSRGGSGFGGVRVAATFVRVALLPGRGGTCATVFVGAVGRVATLRRAGVGDAVSSCASVRAAASTSSQFAGRGFNAR